ncbi:hypothetical protein JTB14_019232 [Gonioctena quinquepunctata]|nr:hypothetical protein JTB14_019232 [Gonioctena quinquepunctata]
MLRVDNRTEEAVEILIVIDYEDPSNMPISKEEYEDVLSSSNYTRISSQIDQKPFYERIREHLFTPDLSLPKTFSTKFNPPFPWTIKLPNCDTSLTHFDKLSTNSQAIKNELNRIISNYFSYTEIYTDASKKE